jgi:hypothetical protein
MNVLDDGPQSQGGHFKATTTKDGEFRLPRNVQKLERSDSNADSRPC